MSALDHQVGETNHYRHGKIQPVQYIEANKLQFLEGCVVKRVTRHDKPGGKGKQDIEKAIHELQLLLEQRYPVDALPGEQPQPAYEDVERPAKVAEPDADGWIAWGGGNCPVAEGTKIEVVFRYGRVVLADNPELLRWDKIESRGDILCFRIVKEEPQWRMVSEPGDHSKIKAAYKPGMEWTSAFEGSKFYEEWVDDEDPLWDKKYRYAIRPAQGAQA